MKSEQHDVMAVFKQFQQEREQQVSEAQQRILEKLTDQNAPETWPIPENAEEAMVLKFYREYAEQRDANKQEVMANILQYAAEHVQADQHVIDAPQTEGEQANPSSRGWVQRVFSAPGRWLKNSLSFRLGDHQGVPAWQLAIPALALVAVVLALLPGQQRQTIPEQIAEGFSIPSNVLTHADALTESLSGLGNPSLGFSASSGPLATSFDLGRLMVDLSIVQVSNQKDKMTGLLTRADRLLGQLGLPPLSSELDLVWDEVELGQIAGRWFGRSRDKMALYRLGFWAQSTKFQLGLVRSKEALNDFRQQMALLKVLEPEVSPVLSEYPLQQRQLESLAKFDVSSLKKAKDIKPLKNKLARFIAVFQSL